MCLEMVAGRYFLAFDHRVSLDGRVDRPAESSARPARAIVDAKELIFDAVEVAAMEIPVSQMGVLVDDRFAGRVPDRAKELGVTLAMSAECAECEAFEFEHGDAFRDQILDADPDITKVLVRHNVEGGHAGIERRTEQLRLLSDWLASEGRQLLLQLLVPPTAEQLDRAGGDIASFERDARPELICRAIAQLQDGGVEPTMWKVEGAYSRPDADAVVAAARCRGRGHVDCLLLGAGAPVERVNRWLRVAAQVDGFAGFAIGRSIWRRSLERYAAGAIDRGMAALQIADAYARFVDVFADPRNAGIA